jgi:hypothetical protein
MSLHQDQQLMLAKFNKSHLGVVTTPSKSTLGQHYTELKALFDHKENFTRLNLYKIVDYFVNPLLTVVKKIEAEKSKPLPDWSDTHELILKCLILILSNLRIESVHLFYDILNVNSLLLTKNNAKFASKDSKTPPVLNVSEEFFCASLQLTQILFKNAMVNSDIMHGFFNFNNLTTLGLLVSIFLDRLVDSNSLTVRIELLKCLSVLSNSNNILKADADLNNKIGVMFASFLPGIAIKLIQCFLLGEDLKILNHKLICSSLSFISNVTARVLSDDLLDERSYQKYFDMCANNEVIGKLKDNVRSLIVNRSANKEWSGVSSEKLFVLIERLFDQLLIVNANDNYHVKLSLVRFCVLVLDKCYLTLNKYADKLLKVLIMMAANDDENNNKDSISVEAKNGRFFRALF